MVEPVSQDGPGKPRVTDAEMERMTALKYQRLQQETNALVQRLMTIEDEKKENE